MSIPIKNIYHMLSYAWNKLEESNIIKIDLDGITTLPDLFARVLVNGTKVLVKKGFDRTYTEHTEEIQGIKGKLELSTTLKKAKHLRQRTICTFDEFTNNTITNQVLFSTLLNLIQITDLNSSLKNEIKKSLRYFTDIDRIHICSRHFSVIKLHRNTSFYIFLMDVCQIVYDNALPSEQPGKWSFMDFTRDERKMSFVFQTFVKRFYGIKYKKGYSVKAEQIKWQFTGEPESTNFLPLMLTDICLENNRSKIIIDTKFYNETMIINYEKERIQSSNLYQLFAYLVNQETDDPKTISCTGILLYPTTNKEYDLKYKYKLHDIFIKTVDLNKDWMLIEERLHEIIN